MINYFNYKKLNDKYLITNDMGCYQFVSKEQLKSLVTDSVDINTDIGRILYNDFFIYDESNQSFSERLKIYYRDSKSYLFSATSLHIFVVTNACNMQCVYCQAQDGSCGKKGVMDEETAKKAVDIALSSPLKQLTFEFQGGEPLLNFDIIRFIVEYSEESALEKGKTIEYNIVSNITMINDEIAHFIKEHSISVSTSIDGNEEMHNVNRKYINGTETYSDVVAGIELLKKYDVGIGAIQTTTKMNMDKPEALVDSYIQLGFNNVFVRNLTPLGCAYNEWDKVGYTPEEFICFYKKCFNYIIELNKKGVNIREGHASIMLKKIITGCPLNYMELRSPCGAGVGQIAYYYDGNIYTCDEGRMLAEMGDDSFKLGNVNNSYDELMSSSSCKAACISSVLESLPNCCDCVYQPYCGTCPVINLALQKNIYNREPNDYKCKIYKGIFDTIFTGLQNTDTEQVLLAWVE